MSDTEEQRSVKEENEERKENSSRASDHGEDKKEETSGGKDDSDNKSEKSEGADEKKEQFFKAELKRLKTSLHRESSKIKPPKVREHFPYVFTNLAPYYNTYTASFLIDPEEDNPVSRGYRMRRTAIGLCDPWDDLTMDKEMLPMIESRTPRGGKQTKRDEQKRREKGEGSTRLPKFPAVQLDTRDIADKKLTYDDVRMLRNKLRDKYSANAGVKVEEDYTRTKQDYQRMELNKLKEVHPSNRSHMKSAYYAYLRNTPGSKRAIEECVKGTEKELKAEEEKKKEQQRNDQQQQQQQPVAATS